MTTKRKLGGKHLALPLNVFVLLSLACSCAVLGSKVDYKVKCNPDGMEVDIVKSKDIANIYLEKFHVIPECRVKEKGRKAVFRFDFKSSQLCGLTKVFNAFSGRTIYYHKLVLERSRKKLGKVSSENTQEFSKEIIPVKCDFTVATDEDPSRITNDTASKSDKSPLGSSLVEPQEVLGYEYQVQELRLKRQALPPGFQEPDVIEITKSIVGEAPVPELSLSVTQNGLPVGDELSVRPGSPLLMRVRLDETSAPTYAIKVSELGVTDTRNKSEIIVINGCSVDTHLFENFVTNEGDELSARFRAFKFPESTYVEFLGVVDVCLQSCEGSVCSNRQVAFGRKKRASELSPFVYQVSVSTLISVVDADSIGLHRASLEGTYVDGNGAAETQEGAEKDGKLGQGSVAPIGRKSVRYLEPAAQTKSEEQVAPEPEPEVVPAKVSPERKSSEIDFHDQQQQQQQPPKSGGSTSSSQSFAVLVVPTLFLWFFALTGGRMTSHAIC